MYRIIEKVKLTPTDKMLVIEAPEVARKAKPGQFVVLRINEKGERIPITIAGTDADKGTVTIVFAEVGKTSKDLGKLGVGDHILNFAAPLGNPIKVENFGTVLCVGGGVFVGALLYLIKELRQAGNKIITVVGARNSEHLIFLDDAEKLSDELYIATDDGSRGYKDLEFLKDLLKERRFEHVFTIGPTSMQRLVSELTRPHNIPTTVSLFPIMVDATGMCGACRVIVGGETKFACVDGPDFDGHKVDFDQLISRMRFYNSQEKIAMVYHYKEVA
ncbi:MAG: sulfide/dihydroorotate dehydrogenase-like FAD/NAD-binding protein [Candidatus Bathyarchaeia archaeon]